MFSLHLEVIRYTAEVTNVVINIHDDIIMAAARGVESEFVQISPSLAGAMDHRDRPLGEIHGEHPLEGIGHVEQAFMGGIIK